MSTYIEVGTNCFCNCIDCDINSAPRPSKHEFMTPYDVNFVLNRLNLLGRKEIRFAGYDPISVSFLPDVMNKNPDMTYKIVTTLLRYNEVVEQVDELTVSLSAVNDYYNKFFVGGKWNLFLDNFNRLCNHRTDIIINLTLSSAMSTEDSILQWIDFINQYRAYIKEVRTFSSLTYDDRSFIDVENLFMKHMDKVKVFLSLLWGSEVKPQSTCHAMKEELYIKHNGDIYPCCMAGGELGQDLIKDLRIGNIFYNTFEEIEVALQTPLRNLNNPICGKCTPKYYQINEKYDDTKNSN